MAEPVTLALAKAHCRIDPSDTDHDEVLATYIQAAREWVEDFTGLVLVSRPFTKAVEAFGSYVQLDRRPVTAVESIAYQIGRANVRTPVTNAHTVCSLLYDKKKN